jgi:integrase
MPRRWRMADHRLVTNKRQSSPLHTPQQFLSSESVTSAKSWCATTKTLARSGATSIRKSTRGLPKSPVRCHRHRVAIHRLYKARWGRAVLGRTDPQPAQETFDYALANGIVTVTPALTIPMRFITKAPPRTSNLSPDEIRMYLQTLYKSNIRRQFKLALHEILLTLVRKSELVFAKWEHVDLESAEWQILVGKNNRLSGMTVYRPSRRLRFSYAT